MEINLGEAHSPEWVLQGDVIRPLFVCPIFLSFFLSSSPQGEVEINLDEARGPLKEWVLQEAVQREVKRRFARFLRTFTNEDGEQVYRQRVREMVRSEWSKQSDTYPYLLRFPLLENRDKERLAPRTASPPVFCCCGRLQQLGRGRCREYAGVPPAFPRGWLGWTGAWEPRGCAAMLPADVRPCAM